MDRKLPLELKERVVPHSVESVMPSHMKGIRDEYRAMYKSRSHKRSFPKNPNLVKEELEVCGYQEPKRPQNQEYKIQNSVTAVFHNHANEMIKLINEADFIVGCVAWLTHPRILDALAAKNCQIIVQKEDFLRPDSASDWKNRSSFKKSLHEKYAKLKCYEKGMFPEIFHGGSYDILCKETTPDPIRCAGYAPSKKDETLPRMHHKFIVACKVREFKRIIPGDEYFEAHEYHVIQEYPFAVWTGSFNFTSNAEKSFENALIVRDEEVAKAYLKEWYYVLGLSEPLDWKYEYVRPEYRVGT